MKFKIHNFLYGRTEGRTDTPKAICPFSFFQSWGVTKSKDDKKHAILHSMQTGKANDIYVCLKIDKKF